MIDLTIMRGFPLRGVYDKNSQKRNGFKKNDEKG